MKSIMPDPNFLIIGAQKCGTTWLSQMIGQHPDAFVVPEKEVDFFNKSDNYAKGIEWYRSKFSSAENKIAIGESTANYFWTSRDDQERKESGRSHDIPQLVHIHYPDIKLILILRDPVQRAISAFYHHIRDRTISPRCRILDVSDHYGITTMGYYDIHLARWLEYFKLDQFLILNYENEICKNKERTLQKVFKFLDLRDDFQPDHVNKKYNSREGHLYMHVHYFAPVIARGLKFLIPPLMALNVPRIAVTEKEKSALTRLFAKHNSRLEKLAGIEVPWVKTDEPKEKAISSH